MTLFIKHLRQIYQFLLELTWAQRHFKIKMLYRKLLRSTEDRRTSFKWAIGGGNPEVK